MIPITIICDTRESLPLDFSKKRGISTIRKGLKTGDYSIDGHETEICFERKSIPDLVGTLIGGHERFLRELERMRPMKEKYILIEHSPSILYKYCQRKHWEYKFDTIINSLLGWERRFDVRVVFCKNREYMIDYIVKHVREFIGDE